MCVSFNVMILLLLYSLSLKHEADGETQDVLASVEQKVMGALIAFYIDGRKALGYVVQAILEGEVEENA